MPKCRSTADILVLVLVVISIGPAKLAASAGPPDVTASSSINGRFIVVTRMDFDSPDPTAVKRILRSTYEVLEAEPFINSKNRLSSPARFWSQSAMSWRVMLEGGEISWPMVSDDGRYLVLVGVSAGFPGQVVLRIYRKQVYEGTLVKSFEISDFWTPAEIDSRKIEFGPDGKKVFVATDASPEWFASGSLAFAPDGQHLVYRTQWNDILSIQLADGSISREPPGR